MDICKHFMPWKLARSSYVKVAHIQLISQLHIVQEVENFVFDVTTDLLTSQYIKITKISNAHFIIAICHSFLRNAYVIISYRLNSYANFGMQIVIKNVRISFALKIAIGQLNELVSQIGKHQITG